MFKRYLRNKMNYFLLMILLLGVQCSHQDMNNKIVGKWYAGNDAKNYIEFTSDGRYRIIGEGNTIYEYSYEMNQQNDSTIIFLKEPGSSEIDIKVLPKFAGENLILVFYKSFNKELSSHIDQLGVFRKESNNPPVDYTISPNDNISKYYFRENYTGKAYIAYNQSMGQPKEFDDKENKILRIDENGLCKTRFMENPFGFAMKKFKFFYRNDTRLKEIPQITVSEIGMLKNNNNLGEVNKYHNDSVYVCIWGYNPDRGYLNESFGESITGNVEQFEIDTLRNLIARAYAYD